MQTSWDAWLQYVPWLVPALLWIGGFLLLWALASPIAHVAATMLDRLRAGMYNGIQALRRWNLEMRAARSERAKSFRQEAIASGAIRDLDSAKSALWQETIAKLTRPLEAFSSRLGQADSKTHIAADALNDVLATASKIQTESLNDIRLSVEELKPAEQVAARRARVDVCIGLVLLGCIVPVNTVFLSQILRDADLIPSNIRVGTLQLYWIFALLITFVEAGIGFLHGFFTAEAEERKRGPSLAGPLMLVLAFGVAFVEGYFYSRIGANRTEVFMVPILNRTMTPEQIFFGWGFVLVGALFTFGTMSYRSLSKVIYAKSIRKVTKEIRTFQRELSLGTAKIQQDVTILKDRLREALDAHCRIGQITPEKERSIKDVVAALRDELQSWRRTPPEWAEQALGEAAEGHWNRLQLRSAFLLWLTVFLVAVMGRLVLAPISSSFASAVPGALFLGIGLSIAFPMAGFLLRRSNEPIEIAPRLKDFYNANGLIFVIVFASISLITLRLLWIGDGTAAVIALCSGVLLVFGGYELSNLMPFVGAHLLNIWHKILSLASATVQALLWVVYGMLSIVSALLAFCAAPIRALLRRWAVMEAA